MSATVVVIDESRLLKKAAKAATFTSLTHAAGYIYRVARNSIRSTAKPSSPGSPPHSRPLGKNTEGKNKPGALKRSFAYDVDEGRQTAVIGPTRSAIGLIAATHEFGGQEPAKAQKENRFQLRIGGHGPIRNLTAEGGQGQSKRFTLAGLTRAWKHGDELLVVRLNSDRQLERAKQVAASIPPSAGGLATKKPRVYPKRPFMGPALLKTIPRLPAFWANSIRAA